MELPEEPFNLAELEHAARSKLPSSAFNTLFGSQEGLSWRTNAHNIQAFDRLPLRPRVLTGITERKLSTTVLGQEIALPIMAAPSGSHQRVHAEGEVASARGSHSAGTVMMLSTVSNFSIEEVAQASNGLNWFQSYVLRDRAMTADLIQRAEAAGFTAIVLTVDNISGRLNGMARQRLYRHSWENEVKASPYLQRERILRNFAKYSDHIDLQQQHLIDHFDTALNWSDLDWMRSITRLPIVIKGIQTVEDAVLAIEHGAQGIVVSNHGGTTAELDGQPASLELLEEIAQAVDNRIEVYFDGGIRRGRDVLKALALGARAVLIGRPIQWGLICNGTDGVKLAFDILARELDSAMASCGVADVSRVQRSVVGHFRVI